MKLIIINGPCGVGKSTVARKLHETLPLSFLLDIDEQRSRISKYREYLDESRGFVNTLAVGIVETCCKEKRDVIVEKMINDEVFLDTLIEIGKKYDADAYEFILWASKDIVMKRALDRGYREGGSFTPEKCERFWNDINALKDRRPTAKIIDTGVLGENDVFNEVSGRIK